MPLTLNVTVLPFMVSVTVPLCAPTAVGLKMTGMLFPVPVAPTVVEVTENRPLVLLPVTCWL